MGAHVCMVVVSVGIEATFQRYWWFVMALLTAALAAAIDEHRHRRQRPQVGA